jgi:tetratricopeptide (TPR) repeat protein
MPRSYSEEEIREIVSAVESADKAFRAGDFAIAEQIYSQAMPILEQALGPEDPDTITCLQNLADCALGMARYETAVGHYEKLVGVGEKILGKKHPDLVPYILKLGKAYELAGRQEDADKSFKSASRITQNSVDAMRETADGAVEHLQLSEPDVRSQREQLLELQRSTQQQQRLKIAPHVHAPYLDDDEEDDDGAAYEDQSASQKLKRASARMNTAELRKVVEAEPNPEAGDDFISLLKAKAPMYAPLVGIVLVIGLVVFVFLMMPSSAPPPPSAEKKPVAAEVQPVAEKITYYATPGEQEVLNIEGDQVAVRIGKGSAKCPIIHIGDRWTDIFTILFGSVMYKEIWFQETPEGLQHENGPLLYASNAPEMLVAKMIEKCRQKAQNWYLASQKYPQKEAEMVEVMYTNPISQVPMSPTVTLYETAEEGHRKILDLGKFSNNETVEEGLRKKELGLWHDEISPLPCAIHCLSVVREGQRTIQEFFVHGFDRNRKLIGAAKEGSVFLVALKDGEELKADTPDSPLDKPPVRPFRVVIAKVPEKTDLRIMHYIWALIFFGLAIVSVVTAGFERTTEGGSQIGAIARSTASTLVWVFVALCFLWLLSFVLP